MEIMLNNQTVANKLESMIGKTYMYRAREVTIHDISTADGQVKFINDGSPIVIDKSEIKEKLNEFLPVSDNEETLPAEMENEVANTFQQTDDKMDKLEKIILTNIERIQKDSSYLPQAKQVNKDVNTILKMNQQKIDLFREVRKTKLNIKK